MLRTLLKRGFEAEIPNRVDAVLSRHLRIFHVLVFPFLIGAGLFGFLSMLGASPETLASYWAEITSNGWFMFYFAVLGVALVSRLVVTFLGYAWHRKTFGHAVSPRYIIFMHASFWVFQIAFALSVAGAVFITLQAIGAYSHWTGHEITWSASAFQNALSATVERIPTLIALPYFAAFVCVYLATSFFEYWQHRLPHESRFLWLLAHRPHHTSTTLTDVTVMEADPAFVFGFLNSMLFAFLAGVSAKLIHPEPMIYEFLAVALIKNLTEVFNHSSVFYERIMRLWERSFLVKLFFMLPGTGPYHYLHHTSKQGDEVVNIGGGPFMLWDRVFGTFREPPKSKPAIGLTNQPEIYINPMTHVFSGAMQIFYELWHNKSLGTRLKVLFGSAYYTPPISKDFLKKPPHLQPAEPSLPHVLKDYS